MTHNTADPEARIAELLAANNREVERRRKAERVLRELWFAAEHAVDAAEDEGDRIYFGSMNDYERLKEVIETWRRDETLAPVYAAVDAEQAAACAEADA